MESPRNCGLLERGRKVEEWWVLTLFKCLVCLLMRWRESEERGGGRGKGEGREREGEGVRGKREGEGEGEGGREVGILFECIVGQ